jgi:hypothetical protein
MISELVISFTIGPYYLDKNAEPVIDQDAGYWILDTGHSSLVTGQWSMVIRYWMPKKRRLHRVSLIFFS